MKSKAGMILNMILLLVSILLMIGVKWIFGACGMHDDGAYGSCHWAEQAVFGMGIVLTVQSLVLLISKNKAVQRAGGIGICAAGIVTALIPNGLIPLCVMPSMRCLSAMRPCVLVCAVVIAVLGVCILLVNREKRK